ncbi:YheC/YheD family protein [Cohnella kolymensis]|uniref:YheC/YheD family protein n=1 Tax=Cohnella kolymensis TaxID=1590652 RepID=UPI000AB60862|nr:YheC/YheD family protein [Cohnella kolymensis]
MPRHVGSKWSKTKALLEDNRLRQIVLKTVKFNRPQLYNMLNEFGMVYVKPDIGTHGQGVMRVEKADGQFRFQLGRHVRSYASYDLMLRAIRKKTKGRRYLVQRGVHLLTHQGRRFDVRVMVQMNPRQRWETTGMIGRLAAPHKIVTNYHDGGTPLPVPRLLKGHFSEAGMAQHIRTLEKIGVNTGKVMRTRFPGVCEVGLDVGIDSTLKPWIIEVNTRPDPFIFRRLPDQAVFRKIKRYAQAYGRLRRVPQKARLIKRRIR